MLDGGFPPGAFNYWKSAFLAGLSDKSIRTMIDSFARCPTPMGQLLLERFHGAVTRVGVTDTAFPLRTAGYNLLVLSQWADPKDNTACTAWARDSYAAMQSFMGGGRSVNYLSATMNRATWLPLPMGRTTAGLQRSSSNMIPTTSSA